MLALERRELIQILYEELPDKSKVLLGRAVAGIRQSENGVEVELADGTSQRGDLVIGADGVHSIVREAMWQHADAAEPGLITDDERNIMMRNWVCLFGLGPGEPGLRNELSVTSYPGKRAAMTITQPRLTTFLFFWKAETATALSRPESAARFTAQDADRAAAGVAHLPVNETMVFGDFWNKRTRAQLSHIEEGVLTRWHYGRLVLAGDAVHKVTPNTAYGGNLAIEGVAVLANQLHRAVVEQRRRREGSGRCDGDGDQEEKDEATPSWGAASLAQADLEAAFRAYQARHESRAREVCATAHWVTRLQTWDTPWLKFWSLYVMPLSDRKALARIIGALVRRAPLLDFVPLDRGPEGKVRWEHGETRSDDGYGKPWRGALAALAAVGLVASFAFFIRRWPLSGYTAREALSSDL
ncbi:hypothetical protein CDD83_4425 [Cordyceps sp. RAO-2017]|nr:hypothetical protein CDD83_4425 [Cordyceps sp. RAO-2017]